MENLDYQRIERAIRFLEAHVADQPGLAVVAGQVGLSEAHFHRMFHRWAGVTPKDFLQFLTLARAREALAASHSLLETSLTVGLSGTGRLHDLFVSTEALTPGEFKRGGDGVAIGWGVHETPFGSLLVSATARGLCGLSFLEAADPASELAALAARWPRAAIAQNQSATTPYAHELSERMRGNPSRPLSLLLQGSPFQLKVWEALLRVPAGELVTYQGLAAAIGQPSASRAVGGAMAANAIAYLIPCHRVIRATGEVGHYRWGHLRKRLLIATEGTRATAIAP